MSAKSPPLDTYAQAIARLKDYRDSRRFPMESARRALSAARGALPADRSAWPKDQRRAADVAALTLAHIEGEWRDANDRIAMFEAFVRVHPAAANAPLMTKCKTHDSGGAWTDCYVGPDAGWYRDPKAPVQVEREPGADDDV